MWWSPAWQNVVRFGQAWEAAFRLRLLLFPMRIPHFRRGVTEQHHLLWLNRNLHINYGSHPNYNEAKRLIRFLLKENLVEAHKEIWGSM